MLKRSYDKRQARLSIASGLAMMGVLLVGMGPALPAAAVPDALSFKPTDTAGEFRFNTGTLKGVLRGEGKSLGLLPFTHTPSDTPIVKWPGVFTYYRLFTTNQRYGESARETPSEVTLLPDGALKVQWAATPERPFDLSGIYRWTDAKTLDLETVVTAKEKLPNFEVFLSSYFAEGFQGSATYAAPAAEGNRPGFLMSEEEQGKWHVFPRNKAAVDIVQDGRWTIPPSPVDWVVRPCFTAPLIYRVNPEAGIAAVLMAPPEDCFALLTPCQSESHRSMYLALFGRTIAAGETAQAHARFVLVENQSETTILDQYHSYLDQRK